MGKTTGISWTDHTFNPVWGCIRMSPGCEHCYAETLAKRWGHDVWGPSKTTPRRTFGEAHWREPLAWNRDAETAGVRRRVFCGSMCDIFEDHPTVDEERTKLWPLIKATPQLDWLLLTKRPERIAQCLPDDWGAKEWNETWERSGYPNVWLGTSVENAHVAYRRPVALLSVPARLHFLSVEPLLERVEIMEYLPQKGLEGWPGVEGPNIGWVIVGGESGPKFRRMDFEWARYIRRRCKEAGVPFFFKQRAGLSSGRLDGVPNDLLVQEFPSTAA